MDVGHPEKGVRVTMTRHRETMHGQRGQVLPILAFSIIAILGLASLAVDIGMWRAQQRSQQSATDAAAMAGAIQIDYSRTGITAAAKASTAQNNFTDDSGVTTSVTVHSPPNTSTKYAGNTSAVEVIVQKKAPMFFASFFGITQELIYTRAVALNVVINQNCLYALNKNNAVTNPADVLDGAQIIANGCGILNNGTYTLHGGNSSITAPSIYEGAPSTGNYYNPSGGAITPQVIVPQPDPCGNISGCASLQSVAFPQTACAQPPDTYVLTPGVHYCSISSTGTQYTIASPPTSSTADVVYVDGLNLGGQASITGTATIFDNESTQLNFHGASFQVNPPTTTGSMGYGVALYAPNASGLTDYGNAGTSGSNSGGLIYVPNAACEIKGTDSTTYSLVCDTLTVDGNKTLTLTGGSGNGIGHSSLVE